MLNSIDYENIIIDALFDKGIIDKELYLKCNPVISDLPYDLRTSDIDELMERMDTIDQEIIDRDKILSDAEHRIGVKQRDIDRLGKRLEKNQANIDKSVDDINKESDKIVKSIEKSSFEDKIKNWSDESIEDNGKEIQKGLLDSFNDLRKAHNDFFKMDLEPNNVDDYRSAFETYKQFANDFHSLIVDANNNGIIFNKSDIKNGDISANLNRIEKNIDKFIKNNDSMSKDGQKINDDFVDIDYITRESKTVITSRDALSEEYDRTLNRYLDLGGDKSVKPGFNQEGKGSNIPQLIDDMNKLQKELGKKYPFLFT